MDAAIACMDKTITGLPVYYETVFRSPGQHERRLGFWVDRIGKADYVKVLDYYAQGFVSAGFEQAVQSSTRQAETHEYTRNRERFTLKITQKSNGVVGVRIETAWP